MEILNQQPSPSAVRAWIACHCATNLEQVESAWGLVYERYVRMGFIEENQHCIYAHRTDVGEQACVIWGTTQAVGVSYTLTVSGDSEKGLALDSVYHKELNEMRRQEARLLEVGLLASRQQDVKTGLKELLGMMRWAVWYACHTNQRDVIVGVHPKHVQFYKRYYGLEQFASESEHPLVKNKPVVPLHVHLPAGLNGANLPRGLLDARIHPIPAESFSQRFNFSPKEMHNSRLERFVIERSPLQ